MINKENVGKMIASQRKVRNLTQRQLADILHVSYQAVSKWESGISLPTVEMISDIAETLSVTVDSLLNGTVLDNRDRILSIILDTFYSHILLTTYAA